MAILSILSGQLLPLVCGLLGLYIVRAIVIYAKLRQFGGPLLASFTDWPHSKAMLRNNCHEWYGEVNRKYGPIARVAPKILITSSPEIWAHVNNKPGYKRSDWYYHAVRIEYRKDNVFSETDNEKHDRRRKQMAPGYSGRENLDLEKSIDERLQDFLDLIRTKYVSSDSRVVPVDLGKKVQYFTLDVISGVGLGKTFGMLRSDSDVDDYIKSSEEGLVIINLALALGFSWLAQAPFIGRFVAPSPTDNNGLGKMMATCFRYVDERTANPTSKQSDMLASFMRHGLNGAELRTEALEQIIAGSDTTAGAIRGTLLHIMTNPRVYRKLQREVDSAARAGNAPLPGEGLIASAQAKQLPYLQAVIREALRIWPPVVNIFPRDVPAGGDTVVVDGESVFLPGGVCIGYSAYAMHRSEDIYGMDADAFRPERWFESDPAKLARMVRTNDLTFGHGKFQCLGKPVAQIEIGKTIFELMRNFDLALINPTRPWKARNYLGLFAISDMWVQVMDRTS
ncbi:Pisatin demethylase [Phialemonium atrogriseum]|uniref:Cytochrome P450 monooxygenase ABA1 n=1 Tax=Phialemonium atrogriseum TaxID=1093897 RepID=A0AAJ0FKD3_9PEZI|nr:Pisatin demethylase [Phialemonium atrogriseum]KAK1763965.1 Pisatin demethylase [Phialemonium atrogriseum]